MGPARRRRLDDAVAAGAGTLGADVADHPEAGRDVLQDFGDLLAQGLQGTATVGALGQAGGMDLSFAGQMIGQ